MAPSIQIAFTLLMLLSLLRKLSMPLLENPGPVPELRLGRPKLI